MARDALYADAAEQFGRVLERLARAYESDSDRRADLLQDIHVALWRSLERFDGRCSMRTWVYRVAHNVAASTVVRRRSRAPTLVSLDELEIEPVQPDVEGALDGRRNLERLMALVQRLNPLDRQIMLLYLEDVDAASIGEVTGLSPGNVATKVHRIKKILTDRFQRRGRDDR
jgi:RNA polymerase sigma-70 factor (ECF subfamily)